MNKKISLLLSVVALSSLSACNLNPSSVVPSSETPASSEVTPSSEDVPSSVSSAEPASSSEEPASSSVEPVSSSSEPVSSSSEPASSSSDPVSSSSEPVSSSEEPASSSSEPSSSEEPPVDPITTDIIIPSTEYDETIEEPAAYRDDLLLNHQYISVVVDNGENESLSTQQLRGLPQYLQPGTNLAFKSNDESIATVDANGVVKGIKQGETTIEVTVKDHPDVKRVVPVNVYKELRQALADPDEPEGDEQRGDVDDSDTITDVLAQLTTASESEVINEIVDHELYEKRIYKNNSLHMYSIWDQGLVCSVDDAYFRIYETDGDSKTDNGAMTFKDYEWVFNTNQYYDTYVFHTSGDVKNYYPVSTVSYMDQPRTEPMYEILDNLFTSGREIFTSTLEKPLLSSFLEYATKNYSNVTKNGFGAVLDDEGKPVEGMMFFDCTIEFKDSTADQDDESRYGIPYGTPTPTTQQMRFTIKDNQVIGWSAHIITNYEIGNDKYQEVYDIDHLFERITDENRASYIFVPNIADYNLVDYLFAI